MASCKVSLEEESSELLEKRTFAIGVRCRFADGSSATSFSTDSGKTIEIGSIVTLSRG